MIQGRPYQSDADYWRIREFLRQVFLINGRRECSWPLARFDYWYWYGVQVFERDWCRLEESVFLWEDAAGQLVGVLNPETHGDAFLQMHPHFSSPALESEMLATAEERLPAPRPGGKKSVRAWALESDRARQELLVSRGYTKSDEPEYLRRRTLEGPLAQPPLPPGYTIRAIRSPEDLKARSLAAWEVFHPPDTPIAPRYSDGEWLKVNQRIPIYRRDLDLVVTAAQGEIAAFCTVWYDDATRTGYFEPVGTAPAHQRRGLGKALLGEGLLRLQALGGDLALVGAYTDRANALYASAGFSDYELLEPWEKTTGLQ